MSKRRVCKKKDRKKLEEAKNGDYYEKIEFYTEKAKRLWGSNESCQVIRQKLIELQKFLQI
jgi:hypothetical protein